MIGPSTSREFRKDFDWVLLVAAISLSIISLVEIYSSTIAQPTENFFMRQLAWVCVGIVLLFIVAAIDYHLIAEHIPWLYLLAIGVLLYTLAMGHRVSGSKSWVNLGPVAFQPSELIKMVVVIALARYFADLRSSRYMSFSQITKACLICLVPVALVASQPDLGTALTYLPAVAVIDHFHGHTRLGSGYLEVAIERITGV